MEGPWRLRLVIRYKKNVRGFHRRNKIIGTYTIFMYLYVLTAVQC